MRRIDPTTWARKHHYAFYRSQSHPYFGLTSRVQLGGLHQAREDQIGSPYALFLFAVCHAANTVPQLRQRIRIEDGVESVVEHESVDPAFVVPAGDELFNFTTVAAKQALGDFCSAVRQATTTHKENPTLAPFDGVRDDVIYCTCLPWLDFTHISHPVDTRIVDSVPRFAWGQFQDDQSVAVNLQVHHALVDGRHVAAFFRALHDTLQTLPSLM